MTGSFNQLSRIYWETSFKIKCVNFGKAFKFPIYFFFKVKAMRNFELNSMMGSWYVVQYYASSEELPEYACMRSLFDMSEADQHVSKRFFEF